jgi:hypothetical protein
MSAGCENFLVGLRSIGRLESEDIELYCPSRRQWVVRRRGHLLVIGLGQGYEVLRRFGDLVVTPGANDATAAAKVKAGGAVGKGHQCDNRPRCVELHQDSPYIGVGITGFDANRAGSGTEDA